MRNRPVRQTRTRAAKQTPRRMKPNAAGIDCGSRYHHVAVPPDRDGEPVRRFQTLTPDLHRLADWLQACGVDTVAMEATGVYWIPIYDLLEARGIEVVLVNAHHIKNVPGRKTDVVDCQWLQELHSFGLLRGSFRPSAEIASLRAYLRHRDTLVRGAADHIRRMQKCLVLMNIQLHNVITDITGLTGVQILRDIANGVTDPHALAAYRDHRCRASAEEIAASLTGSYRPEHLLGLQQNLELYDTYQRHISRCDEAIEALLQALVAQHASPVTTSPATPRQRHKNEPRFEIRSPLHRLVGADLTKIDALGPYTALRLIAEIGTDMTRWPTARHFTSWLTLAPKNKITGGRLISSRTQPSASRAAAMLRMCAMAAGRTSTALGAYYRRLAYRVGKPKAITATARKLAVLVYRVLRGDFEYLDPGADAYEAQHRTRSVRNLRTRAQRLGLGLIDLQTGALVEPGVS
ncbi:MAG: IS110 family transposase [Vicinamibacterales bacterium]